MADGSLIFDTGIDTSGIEQDTPKMKGALDTMAGVLTASLITAVSSTVANAAQAALKGAFNAGAGFETSMSNVAALSGAAGDALDELSEKAKALGSSTKFSASQAADAFGYMALAGWDTEQMLDGIDGVMQLAAASGMDLAKASDVVTDYMSAFNMEASKSSYFADMMAYAQANANLTVDNLAEAYRNCAANMNAAGQSVETTTSMLAMMANQGAKGSQAGTKLTAMMRDLTNKMEDGAVSINGASIAITDAQGNFRDMAKVLPEIDGALEGLGTAERTAALGAVFTADSLAGVNLLLNAGTENISAFADELRAFEGAASDMADTMNDNLTGRITEMNSALEGLGIAAFDKFSGPTKDAVTEITDVINKLKESVDGDLSEPLETLAEKLGDLAVKGAEFAADEGLPKLIDASTWFVDHIDEIGETALRVGELAIAYKGFKGVADVAGIIQGIGTAMTRAGVAAEGAAVGTAALGTAMSALPLVAVGAGLTVCALALKDYIDNAAEMIGYEGELKEALNDTNKEIVERYDLLSQLNETDPGQALANAKQQYDEDAAKIEWNNHKIEGLKIQRQHLLEMMAKEGQISKTGIDIPFELDKIDQQIAGYEEQNQRLGLAVTTEKKIIEQHSGNIDEYTDDGQRMSDAVDAHRMAAQEYAETNRDMSKAIGSSAEMIEKLKNDKITSVAMAQEEIDKALSEKWKELTHNRNVGLIASDEALYKERLSLLAEYGDESRREHWSYYEQVYAYEQDRIEDDKKATEQAIEISKQETAQKKQWLDRQTANVAKALDEQEQKQLKSLEKIESYYKGKYDELAEMQDGYRQKLLSLDTVFEVRTEKDKDGNETKVFEVKDIAAQIEQMKRYHEDIKQLKADGASQGLIDELNSMSGDDAAAMAAYIAGLSETERKEINALYDEKQALAEEMAQELYSDDLKGLQDEYAKVLDEMALTAEDAGYIAGRSFSEGFADGFTLSDMLKISAVDMTHGYQPVSSTVTDMAGAYYNKDTRENITVNVEGGNIVMNGDKIGRYTFDYSISRNREGGN